MSAEDMAQHYSSTVGSTIGKKFATKRAFAGQPVPKIDGPVSATLFLGTRKFAFSPKPSSKLGTLSAHWGNYWLLIRLIIGAALN